MILTFNIFSVKILFLFISELVSWFKVAKSAGLYESMHVFRVDAEVDLTVSDLGCEGPLGHIMQDTAQYSPVHLAELEIDKISPIFIFSEDLGFDVLA